MTCETPSPDSWEPFPELSASMMAPSELAELRARRAHGLPIDLVEPDAPAPQGDRLPCHLFMPEVEWPEALPPVLRTPRRELYLQAREPWVPGGSPSNPVQWAHEWPDSDALDAEVEKALRAGLAGLVCCVLALLVMWGLS